MPSKSIVDQALDAAVAAFEKGAQPWAVPTGVKKEMRGRFAGDFVGQIHSAAEWRAARGTILWMAFTMGRLAALFAVHAKGPKPGRVTLDQALAGGVVVQTGCTAGLIRAPRGRYCNQAQLEPVKAQIGADVDKMFGSVNPRVG